MKRTKDDTARTRAIVLDAAAEAFFENGVSRTSLDQVARRAGLTRGAIYWHFKDKAELISALHSDITLPHECAIEDVIAKASEAPLDALEAGGISFLDAFANDERQQRIFSILTLGCEFLGPDSEIAGRITKANAMMFGRLRTLLEMAYTSGSVAPEWNPDTAARAVHCTMNGLLTEWIKSGRGFPLHEVGALTLRGLINSIRRKA